MFSEIFRKTLKLYDTSIAHAASEQKRCKIGKIVLELNYGKTSIVCNRPEYNFNM